MKANEAPEKIYLQEPTKVRAEKRYDNDVEYVRIDTFIEKACEWLKKELPVTDLASSNMLKITFKVFDKENKKRFIENFKKYMKGE